MPILVLGLSHRTCAVEVRERFAFPDAAIPAALEAMRREGLAEEGVIVSTCNRVELYVATPLPEAQAFGKLQQFLASNRGFSGNLNGELYTLGEPRSIEHLFKVVCGLDSMVLGETEILGQVKKAYDLALSQKLTGSRLNKAFQKAFNVAKQIRTDTNIQRGSVSVASVAVELAERIFGSLADHNVMVIGAGDTSEKTARAFLSRGARELVVANRSIERAQFLAHELGGRAVSFESWPAEFPKIDIAISSTSAPHYVLTRGKLEPLMEARGNRSLLLIDIAVPRDIDPEVNLLDGVFLYNIDDLQSIAESYLKQRQEEIARCESLIRQRANELLAALQAATKPRAGTPATAS